jgi:dTDP-4-dehydrorhamnose reductase
MKKKIIVTGANGQVGQELAAAVTSNAPGSSDAATSSNAAASSKSSGFDVIFLSREQLPLDNPDSIRAVFETHRPAYCINCAAYTAVDKAESEKDLAFRINGDAVGDLAAICAAYDTKLIHISTDYVFDGNSSTPLKETDPTAPLNIAQPGMAGSYRQPAALYRGQPRGIPEGSASGADRYPECDHRGHEKEYAFAFCRYAGDR